MSCDDQGELPESSFVMVCIEGARVDRILARRLRDMDAAQIHSALDHAALVSGAAALELRADNYERKARRARKKEPQL